MVRHKTHRPRLVPVLDLHGTVPRFKSDDDQLAQAADSMSLNCWLRTPAHGAAYGDPAALARGDVRQASTPLSRAHVTRRVNNLTARQSDARQIERLANIAPQLSFNFGDDGDGWSYLSGGIGTSQWSVVRDGSDPLAPDLERLKTINYEGSQMVHQAPSGLQLRRAFLRD